jgi:hypothetical protein
VVNEVVVEPLGFAQHAFRAEAQTLRHRATAFVLDGHRYRDAIQVQIVERMADQPGNAPRHDAPSLIVRGQPIPDFAYPVGRFDPVKADNAAQSSRAVDGPHGPKSRPPALDDGGKEFPRVFDSPAAVHPRKPRTQMKAIGFDQGKQIGSVFNGNWSKRN